MAVIRSDFQDILPDDSKQYQIMAKSYANLTQEDTKEAYKLMKKSWVLAQRWSELQASAKKIQALADENPNITDLKAWCYQRYRQCQLIHESCRAIWRAGNEEEAWLRRNKEVK